MVGRTVRVAATAIVVALAGVACAGVVPGSVSSSDGELVGGDGGGFRIIDRGFQEGRSAAAGWPRVDFVVAPAFEEPWPTEFTRKELIDSAMARIYEYLDANVSDGPPSNLNLYFEDSFPEEERQWVHQIANVSASAFSEYTNHDFDVVIGQPPFARTVIAENDLEYVTPDGYCGTMDNPEVEAVIVGGCAARSMVSVYYGETIASGELAASGSLPSIVSHEAFHSVQDVLDPAPASQVRTRDDALHRPLWFWEGGAEFFGYAIMDYAGVASYYVSPWEWWYYLPNPDVGLKDFAVRDVFAVPPEGYWMGQIASEYIVASIGVEGMLEISEALGQGLSWEEAFEQGTGLPMTDFYATFDLAYRSMFEANTELKTFENRECPSSWNCYVQRGTEDFDRIVAEIEAEYRGQDGDGGCDVREGAVWWLECVDSPFPLPEVAENSDHSYPTDNGNIPHIDDCSNIETLGFDIEGWAATFDARDDAGASRAYVSTQIYAKLSHLDTNADGVICSTQIAE